MSKKKKLAIILITAVEVAAILCLLFFLLKGKKPEEASPPTTRAVQTETTPAYASPIDFDALRQVNTDVYAYIRIPDTIIDYPILQGGPYDDYYLDYNIDHTEGFPGCIYTQSSKNTKTFEEFNTVIYGHELADGTMFTPLHNYFDRDFFNTHREIKIYLPDKEYTYKVFAQVTYDDSLILHYYDNNDPESCKAFLDSIQGSSGWSDIIADDVEVTADDHIITLSTCIYDQPENRLLVLAVLEE